MNHQRYKFFRILEININCQLSSLENQSSRSEKMKRERESRNDSFRDPPGATIADDDDDDDDGRERREEEKKRRREGEKRGKE